MKTKEEIFYKHFDDTEQEENFLELKTKTNLKEEILSAMEEEMMEIEASKISSNAMLSDSDCDHPQRNRHWYNDLMYKCYKCGQIIKQSVR